MNEKRFKEKLVEFLVELGKPKRYEVGFVQGNKVINDGLNALGLNAIDILGFAKSANDNRVRKSRGAHAWFKKMYEDGWKYAGNFEQEGLLTNGFIVMEKELPNKTLNIIREELDVMLRDGTEYVPTRKISISAEDVPKELMEMREKYIHKITEPITQNDQEKITIDALKSMGYKDEEISITKIRKPKEGFESDVNDFIIDSQKEPKSDEELFHEETGKNAVWRGKETKAFKSWKELLN